MTENKKNLGPKSRSKQGKKKKKVTKREQKKSSPKKSPSFYWIYAIVVVILIVVNLFSFNPSTKQTDLKDLKEMLENGDVEKVVVVNNELIAEIYIKNKKLKKDKYKDVRYKILSKTLNPGPHYYIPIGSVETFKQELDELQKNIPEDKKIQPNYDHRKSWGTEILAWLIPIFIMIAIWLFIMRRVGGGGPASHIFNIGKSKAILYDKEKSTNVNFNDVAGLDEAKTELKEIVDFLKEPEKYTKLGAKIPKGALLVGPPGTGKTLLAKAVAGEAQVPFFSLSGSDFVEMFVGVGASRVRDLFRQAKEKAPSIIFIDEIDAIGRARGKNPAFGANDERENTLNQLLTEMDGFGTNTGVIIIAATNRADILDRALMRPGRFDRQIYIDLPDLKEREAIFKVHLKDIKHDNNINLEMLARQTPGFSGADIANICNEAALIAARKNKKIVQKDDFIDAIDRVIAGLEKKNKIITPDEKKRIAYHEAGHATVSWLLEHASPLVKVTIIPRGRSLGAAWYLPEERQITTSEQLLDEICAALGGRAAEEIIFGNISTGALSDLEKITKQVYAMVTIYGLNKKIGNISYYDSTGNEYAFTKPYSEKTAELIDEEVKKFIDNAYKRTKSLLQKNKDKLLKVAELLISKEVIFKEDMEKILGVRPYKTREEKIEEESKKNKIKKIEISKNGKFKKNKPVNS